MFVALPYQVCRPETDRSQPEAGLEVDTLNFRFWPTNDGPLSLTPRYKPDAQGMASKICFAALHSRVTMRGFGHELSFNEDLQSRHLMMHIPMERLNTVRKL